MQNVTVSQQELADWLSLSSRRIRELTAAGILRKNPKYSLRDSVHAYVNFLRSETGGLSAERERLIKCQADMAELKLQEKIGTLVDRAAMERRQFSEYRRVRTGLENVASRVSGLLAAERDQAACFRIIQAEIQLTLEELSKE